MITSGIPGLFIGPVILAIGYELFWQWIDTSPYESEPADGVTRSPMRSGGAVRLVRLKALAQETADGNPPAVPSGVNDLQTGISHRT